MILKDVIAVMNKYADEATALDWDNSGLQIGDENNDITSVTVCLDVTPKVVDEAISNKSQLIVSHHPFFFFPIKSITDDTKGRMINKLIKNNISVYSSHTCFDMSTHGINAFAAFRLGIKTDSFLEESSYDELGIGVCGKLDNPTDFTSLCQKIKKVFKADTLKVSSFCDDTYPVKRVAFCSGSGSDYIKRAKELGADVYITSDVSNGKFITSQEINLPIITLTHFESEKCFIKIMRDILLKECPNLTIIESTQGDMERYI